MAIAGPRSEMLKTFSAANPWDAGRRGAFEIHRHFAGGPMPMHAVADERSRLQSYSLRVHGDPADRPLPDSLVSLWLAGAVPDQRIPQLLAGLEPQLAQSDFLAPETLNPVQRAIRRWAPAAGGASVCLLGVSEVDDSLGVGLALIAAGALLAGGSWLFGRRFGSRRRRQERWIKAQLRA